VDLPIHAAESLPSDHSPELPAAQAWTPKKEQPRDAHREKKAAASTPAPAAAHSAGGALFGRHDDAEAFPEEKGKSKLLLIGGGVAALAAIAAVVLFVVKPFGGAKPAETPGTAATSTAQGTLSVDSTPKARVYIDEAPRGTTPLRLDVAAGVHRVRLEADGGLVNTIQMNVVAGKEVSQFVELTKSAAPERTAARGDAAAAAAPAAPTPGFMTVDAPEEMQVMEDGQVLGSSSSGRISLAPGSHLIEFRNESLGFQTTRTVQVLPGKTARVSIPLPEGSLSINATPWAEVSIDGRSLGETPNANVYARAGSHELVFKHPQHGELKQTVVVKPGEIGRVTVNMVR
jgi:hypothetical protein